MARYAQRMKDQAVARLLPPESGACQGSGRLSHALLRFSDKAPLI